MNLEFPYQIVAFLDREPAKGESVYNGNNGWYPQLAIKRRFKLENISEQEFINELKVFFKNIVPLSIVTDVLTRPERMPVQVIHVENQNELKYLHNDILEKFSRHIVSRYPEREGASYYPHVTAEYDGKFVIPIDEYSHKTFQLNNAWLLKDIADENSVAFSKLY